MPSKQITINQFRRGTAGLPTAKSLGLKMCRHIFGDFYKWKCPTCGEHVQSRSMDVDAPTEAEVTEILKQPMCRGERCATEATNE